MWWLSLNFSAIFRVAYLRFFCKEDAFGWIFTLWGKFVGGIELSFVCINIFTLMKRDGVRNLEQHKIWIMLFWALWDLNELNFESHLVWKIGFKSFTTEKSNPRISANSTQAYKLESHPRHKSETNWPKITTSGPCRKLNMCFGVNP